MPFFPLLIADFQKIDLLSRSKKKDFPTLKAEDIGTLFNFVIRSNDIVQNNEVITQNFSGITQSENKSKRKREEENIKFSAATKEEDISLDFANKECDNLSYYIVYSDRINRISAMQEKRPAMQKKDLKCRKKRSAMQEKRPAMQEKKPPAHAGEIACTHVGNSLKF